MDIARDINANYACISDKLRVRLIISKYKLSLYDIPLLFRGWLYDPAYPGSNEA